MAYKEHPLICNQRTVQAILAGRQTQDRRPIKPQPVRSLVWPDLWVVKTDGKLSGMACCNATDWDVRYWCKRWKRCPQVGDHLWVRETWQAWEDPDTGQDYLHYKADGAKVVPDWPNTDEAWGRLCGNFGHWHPSIHMSRWASRIVLEVTDVRVQRVQEISNEDAEAESATRTYTNEAGGPSAWWYDYRAGFERMWNELYAKRGLGWDANPWIWAITFRRLEENNG